MKRTSIIFSALSILAIGTLLTPLGGQPQQAQPMFQQSGTGAVSRTVNSRLAETVSIRDFGAVGDGITDDGTAITRALAVGKTVRIPAGTFLFSAGISIPVNVSVFGDGYKSVLKPSAINGAAVTMAGGNGWQFVRDFRIAGSASTAFSVTSAQMSQISGISLDGGTYTTGFSFVNMWGCSLRDLWTNGATISDDCFLVGADFNGNHAANWYTSNFSTYNVRVKDGGTGSVFDQMNLQGGTYGLAVYDSRGLTFNSLRCENVVYPVKLGDKGTNKLAIGIVLNGAIPDGPYSSHPGYASRVYAVSFDYANGCTLNAPVFQSLNSSPATTITINGDGTGAKAVAIVNAAGTISGAQIINRGTGYSSATCTFGGGSDAAATLTISSTKITAVNFTNNGSGYPSRTTPVAVIYRNAERCTIVSPFANDGINGLVSPMWPWIAKDASADSSEGINVFGDVSLFNSNNANTANVVKTQGFAYKHAVVEWDSNGTITTNTFVPITFP